MWFSSVYLLGGLAAASAGAVLIEPWGADSVRVRLVLGGGKAVVHGLPGALDDGAPLSPALAGSASADVTSGNLRASYDETAGLVVTRVSDGVVLARSLGLDIAPCGTVPPLPASDTATTRRHRSIRSPAAAAEEEDGTAGTAGPVCAADVQSNADWMHSDSLVDGQLHPYDSESIGDCCDMCQRWRPLAGTAHCGGFSWAGPNVTKGPKNREGRPCPPDPFVQCRAPVPPVVGVGVNVAGPS